MGWVLLAIGIILVILNMKAIKKEKSSFNNIFHTAEEDIREFEVRLGEVRKEFSETILELQKEIEELKKTNNSNYIIEEAKEYENLSEELIEVPIKVETKEKKTKSKKASTSVNTHIEDYNSSVNNSIKIEEINKLLGKGLSIEDVSIKLGIGKGEVLLIKELYLK
jgi:hypothetical protein